MLLKVEKGIREGICHSISQRTKANNRYKNNMIKIKNAIFK